MSKNYIYYLFYFCSLATFVQAQPSAHTDTSIDSRLYDAFESGYLENLKAENPFLLQRWNFYLDNAWFITDLPDEKSKDDYPFVQINDLDNINIFLLEKEQKLKKDWHQQKVYRIKDSDSALVFYSGKVFTEKLNEHLASVR